MPVLDTDGALVDVRPPPDDPAPSDISRNVIAAVSHHSRVAMAAVREGWLRDGPGPSTRRGRDRYVSMPWADVVALVSGELRRVYDESGPTSVFGGSYGWSSAGRFHHAQSQVHRFLNTLGGYVRSVNTYSAGTTEVILPQVFDARALRGQDWREVAEHTELCVAFGGLPLKNTAVASGGITRHRTRDHIANASRRGARWVLISPSRADLHDLPDIDWLPISPGTDTALMLAMCHFLIDSNAYDREFVQRHCVGFGQFRDYVLGRSDGVPKTAVWASEICRIPAERITELARACTRHRTLVTLTLSLQRAEHGEQPVWAAVALAALLGQIGLPGGGFGHGLGSLGDLGYQPLPHPLPTLPQRTNPVSEYIPVARISDMLLRPGEEFPYNGQVLTYPDIRLVYWAGGNPFHHHQDLPRLRRAFARPDTIIVNEQFWTATARHADIVLPASMSLERNDLCASRSDPFVSAMYRTCSPPGDARSDYEIFAALSQALGVERQFTEGRDEAAWLRHLYEQWRESMPYEISMDFDEFWHAGRLSLREPAPSTFLRDFRSDPDSHPLSTPSGRIELFSERIAGYDLQDCPGHPAWLAPAEAPGSPRAQAYPLCLTITQPSHRLHSQLDMGEYSQRNKTAGREPILMNPADATDRGLCDGAVVRVFNDRGALLAGLRFTEDIAVGNVQMSTGAWLTPADVEAEDMFCLAGNVNVLTGDLGTSGLSQGCAGSRVLVQVDSHDLPDHDFDPYAPPIVPRKAPTDD